MIERPKRPTREERERLLKEMESLPEGVADLPTNEPESTLNRPNRTEQLNTDPVARFWQQYVESRPGNTLSVKEAYESYCVWCESEGVEMLVLPTFNRQVTEMGVIRKRGDDGGHNYIDVALRDTLLTAEETSRESIDSRNIPPNPDSKRQQGKRRLQDALAEAMAPQSDAAPADEETMREAAQIPTILQKIGEKYPNLVEEFRREMEQAGVELAADDEKARHDLEEFEKRLSANKPVADLAEKGNTYARVATMGSLKRFTEAYDEAASTIGEIELPERMSRFPALDRPMSAALERTGARGTVEVLGFIPAFGSVYAGAQSMAYELAYAYNMTPSDGTVKSLSAAVALMAVAGIGVLKEGAREHAKEHGNRSTLSAIAGRMKRHRAAMLAGVLGLGAATTAATVGVVKTIAAVQRGVEFGRGTTESLKPLTGQIENAQGSLDGFFTALRTKIDRLILIEGDSSKASAEEKKQMSGKSGQGPQWHGKRCLLTGICEGKGANIETSIAQAKAYRKSIGVPDNMHIVDFLKSQPATKAFEEKRLSIFKEIAEAFPSAIEAEASTSFLYRFSDNIFFHLPSTILGVEGTSSDQYAIPRRAQKNIDDIKAFDQNERAQLIAGYREILEKISSGGMESIGAKGQEITLPDLTLSFDLSALQGIIDRFPKASAGFLPSPDEWKLIGTYIREQGVSAFNENQLGWQIAFLALLAFTYGRVTDMNLTPQSVRYDGARRRNAERELPEKIRELRDVEAMIANRIAGVVQGEFGMYRQLFLGVSPDLGRGSLESYIRYSMTKAALKEKGEDTDLSLAASIGTFLRSRPPEETDAFNETYREYLAAWQERIKKEGVAGLDALVTNIFPAFEGFRTSISEVMRDGSPDAAAIARLREKIESMHHATLSNRAEYLKYRIVATRYALEQKQQKNPDAFEAFFKHGIIKIFDGSSDVPVVASEARSFNALLVLSERLHDDEREFQSIKSAGTQLWMRRWKKVGNAWQMPKEFHDDLESSARNPLAMGIGPTMLDATARELDALAELGADDERMAEQLTHVNTAAIPALNEVFSSIKNTDEAASESFNGLQPSFGIALSTERNVPEFQISLLDAEARTTARVAYPRPIPDLARSDDELVDDLQKWFSSSGRRELEARHRFGVLDTAYWRMKKKFDTQYPDLIVPLTVDTRELADFVRQHRIRQYQMAALHNLDERTAKGEGLSSQELVSFRNPQLLTSGFAELPDNIRAVESIFTEVRTSLPRGYSGAYDIVNNELIIRKGSGASAASVRIPLQEYDLQAGRRLDIAIRSIDSVLQ